VTDQPTNKLRAMGIQRPGALDALGVVELDRPTAARGQVEVRVVASAVNPADLKVLRGELAGRFLHARNCPLVVGYDFSGVVEACGNGVTDLAPGDAVFGFLAYSSRNRQGAFAERIVVDRDTIGRKPDSVSHGIAAASATPALTALQSLRDKGRLLAGGRVMVIGAAGGVGSVAIGVVHALGATVTAVCSTYAVEFVRELGADEVIDRRTSDPMQVKQTFDVVFDAAAGSSYARSRHLLTASGAYVTTLPSLGLVAGKLMAAGSRRSCDVLVVASRSADLELVASWLAGGTKIPMDSRFPVRELKQALDRLAGGEVRGRIAIQVENAF
jgi:NADPH:quinone reductase-like Zn-dependent oxidoreductase